MKFNNKNKLDFNNRKMIYPPPFVAARRTWLTQHDAL